MLGNAKNLLSAAMPDTRPLKRWGLVEPSGVFVILDRPEIPRDPGQWVEVSAGFQRGDQIVNGAEVAADKAPSAVRTRCQTLLDASDRRVSRAMAEGNSAFVAELEVYREALRAIRRAGVAPDAWPASPQYQPQEA